MLRQFDTKWFERNQSLLLWLVNFRVFGFFPVRWLFRNSALRRERRKLVFFGPSDFRVQSWVAWDEERREWRRVSQSFFHSGNIHAHVFEKYAWLLRGYWATRFRAGLHIRGWVLRPLLPFGLTVTTFEPVAGANSPVDGHFLAEDAVLGPNVGFTSIRNAAAASSNTNTATTMIVDVDRIDADSFNVYRAVHCYNTASIPDGDTIDAATVAGKVTGLVDASNDGNDYIVIGRWTGAEPTLANADWDLMDGLTGSVTAQSDTIDITGMTAETVQTWTLNATGRGNINLTGVTKLSFHEGHDAVNSAPGTSTSTGIQVYSADHATEPAPLLTVTHSTPAVAAAGGASLDDDDY